MYYLFYLSCKRYHNVRIQDVSFQRCVIDDQSENELKMLYANIESLLKIYYQ